MQTVQNEEDNRITALYNLQKYVKHNIRYTLSPQK